MIQTQPKRYQIVLWETEDRVVGAPALRLEFDTLEEARAALEAQQEANQYRAGVLLEWHNLSRIWDLLQQYP